MRRQHLDFGVWLKGKMKDPDFKAAYDALQPEFATIEAIFEARMKRGLTQKELARKMGTKQSVISRVESGKANPSIAFLQKLASALGTRLEIRFLAPR